jgi:hypothetical protein
MGTSNAKGPMPDVDGNQARAIKIMRDNPKLSSRQLVYRLKENGIERSHNWVCKHRCDRAL